MHTTLYGALGVVVAVSGAAVGFVGRGWQRKERTGLPAQMETELDVASEIKAAAREWAEQHGRPELAGLLAAKVQLAWELSESRRTRGRQ